MLNKTHACAAALLVAAIPASALADQFSFYLGAGGGGSRMERDDIDLDYKVITTGVLLGASPFDTGSRLNTAAPAGIYAADPFPRVKDPAGTDFAWKVFGGVRYGRHIGIEAGYIDLGSADDGFEYVIPQIVSSGGNILRPEQDRIIEVETDIDGFQASVMGYLPVGERFELFGKLGLLSWDRKTQVLERVLDFTPVSQPGAPDTLLYTGGRDPITGGPLQEFVRSGEAGTQNLYSCFPSPIPDGSGGAVQRTLDSACDGLLPQRSDSGTDLALGFGVNVKASERVSLRAEFEWFDIDGTDLAWAATASLVFGF